MRSRAQPQLLAAAAAGGPGAAGGVLRALLGPSPAPRAHRCARVLCGLAALPLNPNPPPAPPAGRGLGAASARGAAGSASHPKPGPGGDAPLALAWLRGALAALPPGVLRPGAAEELLRDLAAPLADVAAAAAEAAAEMEEGALPRGGAPKALDDVAPGAARAVRRILRGFADTAAQRPA